MSDTEIIKALECCLSAEYGCNECPHQDQKHFDRIKGFEIMPNGMSYDQLSCDEWLKKDALDLINRQKAEIERLKNEKDNLIRTYAECQAEAVKDFLIRLTMHFATYRSEDEIKIKDMFQIIQKFAEETVGDADA